MTTQMKPDIIALTYLVNAAKPEYARLMTENPQEAVALAEDVLQLAALVGAEVLTDTWTFNHSFAQRAENAPSSGDFQSEPDVPAHVVDAETLAALPPDSEMLEDGAAPDEIGIPDNTTPFFDE